LIPARLIPLARYAIGLEPRFILCGAACHGCQAYVIRCLVMLVKLVKVFRDSCCRYIKDIMITIE
jgi:hypothetical protein